VLILPGGKGKGINYNELKRLLKTDIPIPSQVILSSTLKKDKGLRSVINKVLIQICAKVGGETWGIDNLPFTNQPTMVIGIDTYQKRGINYIGCAASNNKNFSQFFTIIKEAPDSGIVTAIKESIYEAIKLFTSFANIAPKHIIVIRDGLVPIKARTMGLEEIKAISSVKGDAQLTYILINKNSSVKLFNKVRDSFQNIPPGTLVDNTIVDQDHEDFFLVSQKSTQGISSPTYYLMLYDTADCNPCDIQSLMYKLCFLYCNWNGSIRVPAPVQYAKKAAMFMGDKIATGNQPIKINDRFNSEIRSLYYV